MRSVMKKAALREIRGSLGRYLAILAIIALGVGFFSGVRITTPSMVNTIGSFMNEHELYDLRLVSTDGWAEEDADFFADQDDVRYSETAYELDVIFNYKKAKENVLRVHSLPVNINRPEIVSGRMPQSPDECVVDADMAKLPPLDSKLVVSDVNSEETADSLKMSAFTVVGTVNSPYYVNFERGTTSIGNGSVSGYIYILPEAFEIKRYSELYIKFDQDYEIYSDEYDDYIDARRDKWDKLAAEQAKLSSIKFMDSMGLPAREAPKTYLLDRNTNIGYACFESDSEIVEQVARVFPIFFILVAALVCMTTMSRMVEEQRTQIGVFKALGYSDFSIIGRYLFYSGSAALLGCIIGYTIGIFLFPGVIWITYKMMYIHIPMRFVFDFKLAITALIVSLLCSMGVTWLSCRHELSENSAGLMRPKAPKAGKRVLLEHLPIIWNRLKFLHKVSLRNIFRYKKRFFMMITGISGCMALLLAGFGLKDSIAGFADDQYNEILVADASIMFNNTDNGKIPDSITEKLDSSADKYVFYRKSNWDILYGNKVKSIDLMIPESYEDIDSFMHFRTMNGDKVDTPGLNEAIVSNSIMERYSADVGDEITLRDSELHELHLKVTGVFENHVYNYIFISPETIEKQLSHPTVYNAAFVNYPEKSDINKLSAPISKDKYVNTTIIYDDLKERMANTMSSLNYIVLLVIASAAGLAFIVIYNLTNINITERSREIATIKVLGFFRKETSAYVLRENIVLTAIGSALGIVLGIILHRFIMAQIIVDLVSFKVRIEPISFLYSIILTFLFNFIVDIFMMKKLERINMAESLKSID